MNLVIDIGNTFAKAALFEGARLIDSIHCRRNETERLQALVGNKNPDACIISCVAANTAEIDAWINNLDCSILRLSGVTPIPFQNNYRTPKTLGSDRIAAIAGAQVILPHTDILIADIGTCLTLDILNAKGVFLGGNISPGPTMRLHALHEGTARLPLVSQEGTCPEIGNDTETAIRSGVLHGIAMEVEGYARKLHKGKPALVVLVTGGKSSTVLPLLDKTIQAVEEPHLVEIGLNAILNYNLNLSSVKDAESYNIL